MTYPKPKPCPICDQLEWVEVYKYDGSGMAHVECVRCDYLGPGEGRIRDAIRSHNAAHAENVIAYAKARELFRQRQASPSGASKDPATERLEK